MVHRFERRVVFGGQLDVELLRLEPHLHALAQQRFIFDDENLVENAAALGARLQAGLQDLRKEDGVGDVRGLGLIAGIEIDMDVEKRKPFPVELNVGGRLVNACRDRGLISRNLADNYLLAPPLVTTPEQIDRIVEIVHDSVREVVGWARRQKAEA